MSLRKIGASKNSAPPAKIRMFCALSQNNQNLFEKKYASYEKLFKELKNSVEILVGQAILTL